MELCVLSASVRIRAAAILSDASSVFSLCSSADVRVRADGLPHRPRKPPDQNRRPANPASARVGRALGRQSLLEGYRNLAHRHSLRADHDVCPLRKPDMRAPLRATILFRRQSHG